MILYLGLITGIILLISALLTPPVFWLLPMVWPGFSEPFSRVFDRVAMLAAVVVLLLFRKKFPLDSLPRFFLPFRLQSCALQTLAGFIAATMAVIVIFPLLLQQELLIWGSRTNGEILIKFFRLIPAAIIVSVIEEGFFRVLFLQNLRRKFTPWLAVIIVSVLYAIAHNIVPVKSFLITPGDYFVGFEYLAELFGKLLAPQAFGAIIGLFVVGVVLGFVMLTTGSVYLCIGMHAAWVCAVKLIAYMTAAGPAYDPTAMVQRRYLLVSLPLSWVAIMGAGALIYAFRSRGITRSSGNERSPA